MLPHDLLLALPTNLMAAAVVDHLQLMSYIYYSYVSYDGFVFRRLSGHAARDHTFKCTCGISGPRMPHGRPIASSRTRPH